jgi:hypothetical protein
MPPFAEAHDPLPLEMPGNARAEVRGDDGLGDEVVDAGAPCLLLRALVSAEMTTIGRSR